MNTTKYVAFESLDLGDSMRARGCKRIPEMVESLRRNGFKDNHPFIVSVEENRRYLVVDGNRRVEALQWLADNDPVAFAKILPDGKIPVKDMLL